jgi:hypothetical protein
VSKKKRKPAAEKGKATNLRVTPEFLAAREKRAAAKGYGKAKWIEFCEAMLAEGYMVFLYEARRTFSKYVWVTSGERHFKVRFSNHAPIKRRESAGDCDFFVGICNFQTTTTEQAIAATLKAVGRPKVRA